MRGSLFFILFLFFNVKIKVTVLSNYQDSGVKQIKICKNSASGDYLIISPVTECPLRVIFNVDRAPG